ncbi:MAG: stage V sporulation protein SpoVM [Ruminococcaceae bacterium]|nr:stage V sporulation protein SpoVM [Oscillospiraceae bacterium]
MAVRVVVVKSPKVLSGILRRLFGIRKEPFEF